MNKLLSGVLLLIGLVSVAVIGCAETEPVGVTLDSGEVVSSCVVCHSDKEMLQTTASEEPEQEGSEATSGEG